MSYPTDTAMKSRLSACCILWLSLVAPTLFAAEIVVPPGESTLSAAIASAADGDTLILGEGTYSGVATINKSLTVRAESRAVHPVLSGAVTIAGEGIRVTMQGLSFSVSPVLDQGEEVRLLENNWVNCSLNAGAYSTAEGDGDLLLVGNRFSNGDILNVASVGAYIAGNSLVGGQIIANSSVWIVGNDISADGGVSTAGHPLYSVRGIFVSAGYARIIGNRVACESHGSANCVHVDAELSLVANNLVEVTDLRTSSTYKDTQYGILAGNSESTVVNNVIAGKPANASRGGSGIQARSPGARVSGNIVVDYIRYSAFPPLDTDALTEVTHNLCFNSSAPCPTGDGNLNVDPEFVDLIDYRLSPNSPAIDAGPLDYHLADLDRSRNDIGAYGGPWSIDQFDAQRDPYTLAPYVYPKFEGISAVQGGEIAVQAIGVARLR